MYLHVALIEFHENTTGEQIASMDKAATELVGPIPGVQLFWHGPAQSKFGADYALVAGFADQVAFAQYVDHPDHKRFATEHSQPITKKRIAAQLTIDDGEVSPRTIGEKLNLRYGAAEGLPQLSGIHHLKIPVTDLAVSLAWYEKVLGATRQPQLDHVTPDGDLYAYILALPGLPYPVEIRRAPESARGISGFDPFVFNIRSRTDLQAWIAHLDALGIEHSPELRGLIGWVMAVRDPDGLSIRMYTEETHEFDAENADLDADWLQYPLERADPRRSAGIGPPSTANSPRSREPHH